MENEMIELVARTIDVPPEELVEWLESRQKVEHQGIRIDYVLAA